MLRAVLAVLATASGALALIPGGDSLYSDDATRAEARLFEERFRAASKPVRRDSRLFIAVYLAPDTRWKAGFIRNSSMADLDARFGGRVDMKFIVGTRDIDAHSRHELLWLQEIFGDYLLLDIPESYDLLTGKTTALIRWLATEDSTDAKYILKADDDSYVHVEDLIDFLDEQEASEQSDNTVYGLLRNHTKVLHWGDKPKYRRWFEPNYDQEFYPVYADGGGYILTKNLAVTMGRTYYDVLEANQYHNEDASLGIWASIINSTILNSTTVGEHPDAAKQLIHFRALPMWKFACHTWDIIHGDVDIRQFHCYRNKEVRQWKNRCCRKTPPRHYRHRRSPYPGRE